MKQNPAITPPTTVHPASSPPKDRFVPGHVLAGRYRMITRLGEVAMGEVWHAQDLVLQTPVALKLIRSTDPEVRGRILDEVRLARRITHPAVCRVFDVGESDGEIFYSRELVQGEDLAALVRRAGRLPSEKVIEIGRELCEGLAAAHAHGVLHRDLKLENVLIDQDGFIRIIDFGMASDGASSEAADLYALGVLLYQLVVGRAPVDSSGPGGTPLKPSAIVDDVDPVLDQAICKAIAPDPRHRPASAIEMAQLLSSGRTSRIRLRPALAALIAVIAAATIFASSLYLRPDRQVLTTHDTILVADFVNTTGEPVFDGALKVALAVALEQSPFLKVFPDERVRETLRLMQRPSDERVTRAVAREVARREHLKALVSGSITRLGTHYVLALEAINADTGDELAREQVEVSAKEEVLTELGSATTRLREKLGESLATIQRFDVPLARATTGSIEALHAYSLALDQGRMVPRVEAIPHLTRAIQLDPDFAMAHALLSGVYANTGQSAQAPALASRAFELRHRVSERERFFISWRYFVDAEQNWDEALDLAMSWTSTYPRECFAFNSLGVALAASGQHAQAAIAFREAIRLDPKFLPPYGNLAGSLIALNRFDEASATHRSAGERRIESISIRRVGYLLPLLKGDAPAASRELDLARRASPLWTSSWEARASGAAGRIKAAHDSFRIAVDAALRGGLTEIAAQWTVEDAEVHAIAGQCVEARREAAGGLELARDNFTLERAARLLTLCDAASEADRLTAELGSRFPKATLTREVQLPVIAAVRAVSQREFARAIRLLEPVKPYDHAPAAEFWPAYLRGEAYRGLKDGRSAAAQYQSIVDHRGEAPTSPLYALAHVGLARASVLTGDMHTARSMYERFFSLWNEADPDLRRVEDVRREFSRFR
jgi:tetratricopeptide (TPR) repeat protein